MSEPPATTPWGDEDPSVGPPPLPAYRPPAAPADHVRGSTRDPSVDPAVRAQARKAVKARFAFQIHLVFYLLVCALLIGIWAAASGVTTFFWPIFAILAMGVPLGLHRAALNWGRAPTEEEVDAEARRIAERDGRSGSGGSPGRLGRGESPED